MEELFGSLVQGAGILFNPDTFLLTVLYMIGGLLLGMFVGALPGLTTLTAMAILLPIVFFLPPIFGIPFLLGIYKGGIYGGSVPAILVSMPGTGAAVATTFDGPALTRQGKGRKALEMALFSSVAGDFTSDLVTIFAIVPIALIALAIGPPELAAVLFLSLVVISATGSGAFVKGLLVMGVGLFVAMIGQDPIGALARFDFGFFELRSGIGLLPMLIGLFALSELLLSIEKRAATYIKAGAQALEGERLKWSEFKASGRTIARSTAIGTSILPLGAGGSHDLNARVLTSILPQYLGQAVIVKLVPGASGQTGTAAAANAPADGYTLLFTHNFYDQLQQHVKELPYKTTEDFVTVARTNSARMCAIVRADSQFKSLQSLFDFGKANPGKVELSHSGQWGATMVPAAQLFNWAKVNVNMTPYRGGGPSLRALLAGDADVTFQFPSTILGQGDKVRTLACVLDEPTLGSPPTFASLGFPGEIGEMHRIVMAPRGVPADRLAKLREAFVALQDDKTYKRLIGRLGEDSNLMSGEDYEKVRVEQSKAYKALVKSMTSG